MMISQEEKQALVNMFCAYCRRTLRNARTDILRRNARGLKRETLFSDMSADELNRLEAPEVVLCEEVVFDVLGYEVVVCDAELADAIRTLEEADQAIILLYYFADWTDRRIAMAMGLPRSTVQLRRTKALRSLRAHLEEVTGNEL